MFRFVALFFCAVSTIGFSQATKKESNESLANYRSLETFARALHYLESMYVDEDKVKENDLIINALKGIVEQLDPHTMIMPKKAFEQLTMDTQGKFGGVGIIVSQERGKLTVVSPIEDTPAYKAGVKSGDEIIEIDGTPIEKLKNPDAVDRMRGDPGSILKLGIKRKDHKDLMYFSLIREVVKIKSVRAHSLGDGIQYARITSFQEETTSQLEEAMQKAKGNMTGLILDLRDNPGGLLDQAVGVADLFIENGVIVSTIGRNRDQVEREYAKKRGTYMGFPIVTLVNGGSASASEIVAGALQDDERSVIMGTTSFGKGSVQTVVSLPDGSGLKLTVARYYTPKGRSIQAKGIKPDIEVADKIAATGNPPQSKKESDLKGHIESADITNPTQANLQNKDWPDSLKSDYQLATAFSYLKSWSVFQKKPPTTR